MSDPGTPMRVPLAAGAVLVAVVVILGGLVVLRRGDATTTTPSAALPAPTGTTASVPTSAPTTAPATSVPAVAPRATATAPLPTAAARPTTAPAATTQSTREPTAAPTADSDVSAVVALVNGTPRIFAPGAAIPTTTPPNWWSDQRPVEPAIAAEIQRAFNRFWDVRVQADYDLNPEQLPQVMGGAALQRELNALENMRSQNRAADMKIDHKIQVLHAGSDEAAVEDDYVSRLTYVDAETKEPVQPTPITQSQFAYRLRKTEGVWRVVDAVRLVDE